MVTFLFYNYFGRGILWKMMADRVIGGCVGIGGLGKLKTGIRFTELAPPTTETEKKVKLFFAHSEQERTFGTQIQDLVSASIESESHSNMSSKGVRRSASAFALDDIDSMMASKKLKKEAGTSNIPKATPPVTRGKSHSKKKKTTEFSDLVLLTDADPIEAQKFIQQGTNTLVAAYDQMVVENADMARQLSELKSVHDNNLLLLQEKLMDLNKSNKMLHEAKIQHAEELEDTISQTKKSAALTVYQARIKMFEEASDPSFDRTKWDVDIWKKYVAELGGADDAETEKAGGSSLVKGVDDGAEGSKVMDTQDDDGEKDKA